MKQILTGWIIFWLGLNIAQAQTFDIVSYTPPTNWQETRDHNHLVYQVVNQNDGTWAQIGIFASTGSKGSIDADLASEWQNLVLRQYPVSAPMQSLETREVDGWKVKSGSGTFDYNGQPATTELTTFSGFGVSVSLLTVSNSRQYSKEINSFVNSIRLQKPTEKSAASSVNLTNNKSATNTKFSGQYQFSSTKFDDGWTSQIQPEWVEVTKGNVKVLLHFAKEGTIFSADPDPLTRAAWDILVAPRYSNLKNFKVVSPSMDSQRAYMGSGNVTDSKGNEVYVVLFRKNQLTGWIEFITPNKETFVQTFGVDANQVDWSTGSEAWNKMVAMTHYNRFPVAASDIVGRWSSWSGSNVQYVNIYTGTDAGMAHAQSGNSIEFFANGTYMREYKGVSGSPSGGNVYHGNKFNGKAIVSDWEIQLTNSENGATHQFAAMFEAVRGGRVLHLYRQQIEELHLQRVD